jgi:hypothetical protein
MMPFAFGSTIAMDSGVLVARTVEVAKSQQKRPNDLKLGTNSAALWFKVSSFHDIPLERKSHTPSLFAQIIQTTNASKRVYMRRENVTLLKNKKNPATIRGEELALDEVQKSSGAPFFHPCPCIVARDQMSINHSCIDHTLSCVTGLVCCPQQA